MYYIVEVLSSKNTKTVDSEEDFIRAKDLAYRHSIKTGLEVEIQNELGKILDRIIAWRE